jgi:hypothetical protein
MVKNHLIRESLGNRTPIEQRTGQTPDISKFLPFRWYEPVSYLNSEGQEELGRWAGVAEHVGDELTYIVISDATGQAMYRSDIRTALDHNAPNFRAETKAADALRAKQDANAAQDTGSQHIFAPIGHEDDEKVYPFAPDDLVGKVFMREDPDSGDLTRCEVVQLLKQHSNSTRNKLKFIIETKNGETSAEEVMEYNQLCHIIEAQAEAIESGAHEGLMTFDRILAHEGPLTARHPSYKGSAYNLLIEWDVGEPTWEPLNVIAKCDPVSVTLYGVKNDMLDKKGWKYLKKHAKNLPRIAKQVREVLKAKGAHGPKYKYGVRLPDREKTFADLDGENGNTKWADANRAELDLLDEFEAFEDCGEFTEEKARELIEKGYQYIKLMMVYDVKHDGRYRARLVAAGYDPSWL